MFAKISKCVGLVCLMVIGLCLLGGCAEQEVSESMMVATITGEGHDTISLSIDLTNVAIDACRDHTAYVYVLPSHMDVTANLGELSPVAEFTPKSHQTIDIPLLQGSTSRQYASFAVGTYDQNRQQYVLLTSACVLSNPQVLQTTSPQKTTKPTASIKGLASTHEGDALALGVSHVILPVQMQKLLMETYETTTLAYTWNGVTYYLNNAYLETLDQSIEVYTTAGVQVYLQFVLGKDILLSSGSFGAVYVKGNVPTDIYLPGVEVGKESYGVNMQDEASALRMEGFFDFMAERYAHLGAYVSFVVGDRVNASTTYANAGNMPMETQIANYEKLVRLVHTAMKAHNPSGEVYISLDHHLGGSECAEGDLGLRDYLDRFLAEVARRGNYDFHVSCGLSAPTSEVWEEDELDLLTVHSLSDLTKLLEAGAYLLDDGSTRHLILTNFALPLDDELEDAERMQAYGYAYAYACLSEDPHIKAFFYGVHMDDKDMSGGLRYQANDEGEGKAKEIYDVFALMDTDLASNTLTDLVTYIGAPCENLPISTPGQMAPVNYLQGEGEFLSADEEVADVVYIANFDQGDNGGLLALDGVDHTEFIYVESLSRPCLKQGLVANLIGVPTGFIMEVSADKLMSAKHLSVDICHQIKEGYGDGPLDIVLILTRESTQEGTPRLMYEGRVSQADDKRWQRATFDISSFAEQLQEGEVVSMSLLYVFAYDTEALKSNISFKSSALSSASGLGEFVYVNQRVCGMDVSISQIFTDAPKEKDHSTTVIVVVAVVVLVISLGGTAYALMFGKRRRY